MIKKNLIKVLCTFLLLTTLGVFVNNNVVKAKVEDQFSVDTLGTFNKVTSQADLVDGTYLIASTVGNLTFFMNQENSGTYFKHNGETAITIKNLFDIKVVSEGFEIVFSVDDVVKYVAYNSTGNHAHILAESGPKTIWNINIESNFEAKINSKATPTRILKYNSNSPRFACYTSSQSPLNLYKLDQSTAVETTNIKYRDGNIGDTVYSGDGYPTAVERDTLISVPAVPKKDLHLFLGWYKEIECQNQWDFNQDLATGEEVVLYAKWRTLTMAEQFELLKSQASLNINYNITQESATIVNDATSNGSSSNLSKTENSAALINLSPIDYDVKSEGGSNNVGVFSEIRFYKDNVLNIKSLRGNISEITISYKSSGNKLEVYQDVVGERVLVESTSDTYTINSDKIYLKNSGTARIDVNKLSITTNGVNETYTINDTQLRLGLKLEQAFYDLLKEENNNTDVEFGTLYYLKSNETKSIKELFVESGVTSIDEFLLANNHIKNVSNTPARVNENGEASLDGTYYQFATVLSQIPDAAYTQSVVVSHYAIVNGVVYLTTDRVESVSSVADLYIKNELSNPAVSAHGGVLKYLADLQNI